MRPARLITIGGAGLAVGAHVWFVTSAFLPFARQDGPEYVLIGAPLWVAAASTLGAALVLSLLVYRFHVTPRALAPLICLAVAPLAAVNLLHGVNGRLSPVTYVLVDLRWWWTGLIVALVAFRIDRDAGGPVRQRLSHWRVPPSRRQLMLEGALFLLVLAAAIVTNTHLRFTAVLHGDEVKYLRYCENFYQGLGFEVEHQRTIDELTLAYSPPVGRNLTLAARAAREELSNVAADVRALARSGRRFTFNRARYAEEWFIRGKNGDFYQVHNPGLAFLLFPAYFVDRHFLSTTPGYQGRLPGELPATNLLGLFIWAIWAVIVFRFLCDHTGAEALAWLLAAAAMLTMPVVAFPFQIYPEAVAGMVLFAVGGSLLTRRGGTGAAFAMGLAAGFLPWLHVRYLILAVVLFAWGLVSLRGRRLSFAAGLVALLGAMCCYAYHLTGSFMPNALYETEGSYSPWRVRDALQALAAYPFDRIWGLFAHAPVYLLALPGIVVCARRQPRATALAALLFLALAVPSAGHGFSAAGATPLRHLVAVVPFLMLPLAYTVMTWGHLRWVRAAFLLLLIVSLDTGLSYNLHHTKEVGRLIDWGTSGWASNLLMPWTHAAPWERSSGNFALFLFWAVASIGLVLLPLVPHVTRRRGETSNDVRPARPGLPPFPYALAAMAVFICFGSAATALGQEWTRIDYFVPAVEARAAIIRYAAPLDRCALCYSSLRGELGRGELVGNTIESFSFTAGRRAGRFGDALPVQDSEDIPAGTPVVFRARVAAREGAGWGALAIDFGDGQASREPNLFGHTDVSHAYQTPGVYRVVATFASAQGALLQRTLTLSVYQEPITPTR